MVKLVDAVDSKSTGATLCRFESDHRHNLKLTTNLGLEASFGKSFRVLVKSEEMIPRPKRDAVEPRRTGCETAKRQVRKNPSLPAFDNFSKSNRVNQTTSSVFLIMHQVTAIYF